MRIWRGEKAEVVEAEEFEEPAEEVKMPAEEATESVKEVKKSAEEAKMPAKRGTKCGAKRGAALQKTTQKRNPDKRTGDSVRARSS